jgi:hypothetical protein
MSFYIFRQSSDYFSEKGQPKYTHPHIAASKALTEDSSKDGGNLIVL